MGEAEARAATWFTTQPIEEPEPRTQLAEAIEWIGWDRALFATDYPHWDFDDPAQALPIKLSKAQRQDVLMDNAKALYRQGRGSGSAEHWGCLVTKQFLTLPEALSRLGLMDGCS